MENTSSWVRGIKNGRIVKQVTVPATFEDPVEPLREALKELDLSAPLWLNKNQQEWENFSQTRFYPQDFVDSLPFDRLEVEYINPKAPKRKSQDPRNAVD